MAFNRTRFEGVFIIDNFNADDSRGSFVKIFNEDFFIKNNLDFKIAESYFSVSAKSVIRGMHFQKPPEDHAKLVYVPKGAILDVVVDLRKNSKTFKQSLSFIISSENKKSIFIPKGFAHGFKSLSSDTITVYNVTTGYAPLCDSGILFNSFDFDWQLNEEPIISERDLNHIKLKDFNSPF